MTKEQAEKIAIQVLAWLGSDAERIHHFLNASGASIDDMRLRAQEPEFLGFVLDFLMLDDDSILSFCGESAQPPENIQKARDILTGEHLVWR